MVTPNMVLAMDKLSVFSHVRQVGREYFFKSYCRLEKMRMVL